jgi:hypothetical protein
MYNIYESIRTIRGAEAFPCRTAIDNNSAEVYNSTEILHKVFVRIRSAKKPYRVCTTDTSSLRNLNISGRLEYISIGRIIPT